MRYRCGIFDLDGVLVDTAKYHYLAWKALADRLGFAFSVEQNESLKGISRMESLEVLLRFGGMEEMFDQEEKLRMAEEKNRLYLEYINRLEESELLPGVTELFERMKERGVKIALGSASKNAGVILERLNIGSYFDVIVDGNLVTKAKPDPEVFALGADRLGIPYEECVVFEDSVAGLLAAKKLNMGTVGIGTRENLPQADIICGAVGEYQGF
ncbi:MAG: beta-phosphoglucomutase [Hungatella hathewayi]|nr:beta-phosphoglucomutase [Hungatella hathewayi]